MAEKDNTGLINLSQIECFTLDKVKQAFEDGSIPEDKLVLVAIPQKIDDLKIRLDNLTLRKEYDLREELTADTGLNDIEKADTDSVFEYDTLQGMYKIKGKIRINMPRLSYYILILEIGLFLEQGTISTDTERYKIDKKVVIKFDEKKTIEFTSDISIWVNNITVIEYKIPVVPKKFSQLENDLDLVTATIDTIGGSLIINKG